MSRLLAFHAIALVQEIKVSCTGITIQRPGATRVPTTRKGGTQ